MADKADTCAVNRKVSHDQFDAACDDLSRGIEDALSKLTQQVFYRYAFISDAVSVYFGFLGTIMATSVG